MPKFCVLISLLLSCCFLNAQSEISGVVNNYAKVLSVFADTCQVQIEVDNASAFQTGDQVLLIQMRGAGINVTNNSSFGDITAMNTAGLYEINEVEAINGNIVFLKYQTSNQYLPLFDVQLVRIPVYQDAEINGILTAEPWNGDTGGICALKVEGQLFMNGTIDVSGLGFRGGDATITTENNCSWISTQDDYFYDEISWRGAAKGEGIAAIIDPEQANGKGAVANGGGGGNDHNSGGGGGANATSGGTGGINDEPSTFGCKGFHPGVGGKAITDNINRLFLGGGGGAGHENNSNGTDGGNGGGIVLLLANEFYPFGFSILSKGETPPDGNGDGAGGGGAGGTILLDVQNIQTVVHLEVQGGDGGLIDNVQLERCHGPGGGGSGGRVITNLQEGIDPVIIVLTGGDAGLSVNSPSCPDGTNGAQDGETGVYESLTEIVVSTDTFHFPNADFDFVINDYTVDFTNLSESANMSSWDFGDTFSSTETDPFHTYSANGTYNVSLIVENDCGSDTIWQELQIDVQIMPKASFTVDQQSGCTPFMVQFTDASTGSIDSYQWIFDGGNPMSSNDPNPLVVYNSPGVYEVQLSVDGPGGNSTLVLENFIEVLDGPTADFNFTTNNLSVDFFNLSQNADNLSWDFGDMNGATSDNPNHIYATSGTYTVQLIADNQCGSDTSTQVISVDDSSPLQAAFTFDDGNGCAPWLVQFEDLSTGDFESWLWTFEGGAPATSTEANPQVLYADPGLFDVQLQISGNQGSNMILIEDVIEIAPAVDADFDFNINEAEVSFFNNTINATGYQWDFGDGSPFSNEEHPVHEYPAPGSYEVTLAATSAFCGMAVTKSIYLEYTNVQESIKDLFRVYPNPVRDQLMVESSKEGLSFLKLYHVDGKEIRIEEQAFSKNIMIDTEPLKTGVYILLVQNGTQIFRYKLIKF